MIDDHERAPDIEVWNRHKHDQLKVPRVASTHPNHLLSIHDGFPAAPHPPALIATQLQCHVKLKREKGVSLTLTNGHFGIRLLYAHDPRRRAVHTHNPRSHTPVPSGYHTNRTHCTLLLLS